jgi:hypothetical protein
MIRLYKSKQLKKLRKVYKLIEQGSSLYTSITKQKDEIMNIIKQLFTSLCEDLGLNDMKVSLLYDLEYFIHNTDRVTTIIWVRTVFKTDDIKLQDLIKVLRLYKELQYIYDDFRRTLRREEVLRIFPNIQNLPDLMILHPFTQKVLLFYRSDEFLFELDMNVLKPDDYNLKFNLCVRHMDIEQISALAEILLPMLEEAYEHLKSIKKHNDRIVKRIRKIARPYILARELTS